MCGITGVFHDKNAKEQVAMALSVLSNRGLDAKGIYDESSENKSYAIGHCLHAIVGHVPQPIKSLDGKSVLVANCEIYNWKELALKYNLLGENDAEVLLAYLDSLAFEDISSRLKELDGVFAFAYLRAGRVFLARDIIGVKPLFYFYDDSGFAFASEKKALEAMDYIDVKELNPRHHLVYEIEENKFSKGVRGFFDILPESSLEIGVLKDEVKSLLDNAILKRVPTGVKIGLLFSGGVDSTYIAIRLLELGVDFTCYTAAIDDPMHTKEPEDLVMSKLAAEKLGLKLEIVQIGLDDVERYLKKVVPLIEDNNVVKVGVATTFFIASEKAASDGCKVIFSGLGSEEIYAGYNRHLNSTDVNKECLSGLRKMYERDLYRDDVLTMENNLELRVPFLDHNLVEYCLKIPSKYKIVEEVGKADGEKVLVSKWIFRQIALESGMPFEFALRGKKAAQYGSRIHHGIQKLSRNAGFKRVSNYLSDFYPRHNLKLGVLFSGGKDSASAAWIMKEQNYLISCLIYIQSKNLDSYMFQSAGSEIIDLQAKAMGLPLLVYDCLGVKEEELLDLKKAIELAVKEHGINGIVTGALFSNYQRDRIEKICDEIGIKVFNPLWHKPQDVHMREVVNSGFNAILVAVAGDGLHSSFLGRVVDDSLISDLSVMPGINVAGEGGEFESLVLDGPLFSFGRIEILEGETVMDSSCSGKMIIKKAKLVEKKVKK